MHNLYGFKNLTVAERNFLRLVKDDCKDNNIRFFVGKGRRVILRDNFGGAGFFTGEKYRKKTKKGSNGCLAVASNNTKSFFFEILVHEYAHMQQWKENLPLFWFTLTNKKLLPLDLIFDYITTAQSGKSSYSQKTIDAAFRSIILLEKDCDKRAAQLIQKYNLPIDISGYIKRANFDHLSYHYVKKHKKWAEFNVQSTNKNYKLIMKDMPTHFKLRSEKYISPKLLRQLESCV